MRTFKTALMLSAFLAGASLASIESVSALPLSPAAGGIELAAQFDAAQPTVEIRNRGAGIAAGIIGGMILGGIIASQQPYYYQPYPPYPYYPAYPAYRPYPTVDGAIAYCMRRFRSYDPYTMTYLGRDGFRHPCP